MSQPYQEFLLFQNSPSLLPGRNTKNMVLTLLPIMLELNPGWVEIAVGNGFEEGNQALNKTLIEVFQTANIV